MNNRRSSILKKPRNVDLDATMEDREEPDTKTFNRKVRFSSNYVKPFTTENNVTVWDTTYEEVIGQSTNSLGSSDSKSALKTTQSSITQNTCNIYVDPDYCEDPDEINKPHFETTCLDIDVNDESECMDFTCAQDKGNAPRNKTIVFDKSSGDMEFTEILKEADKENLYVATNTRLLGANHNSRKTILFNPSDCEADMDLTKQNVSVNKPRKIKVFARSDNEVNLEQITAINEVGNLSNLRKTILFNSNDKEADMDLTKHVVSLTNSRKTIPLAPSGNEGNLEQIPHTTDNLVVGNQGKIVSNSRKTILFNPSDCEADMDLTKQNVSLTKPRKINVFARSDNEGNLEQIAAMNVVGNPSNSRKTILFNSNDKEADMDLTKHVVSSTNLRKTIPLAPSDNEADLEQIPPLIDNLVVGNQGKISRKTILFNPSDCEADMDLTKQVISSTFVNKANLEQITPTTNNLLIGNHGRSNSRPILLNPSDNEADVDLKNHIAISANLRKTNLSAPGDNEAYMEQITVGEVPSNSRKTILFNPNDNEADMDLTEQVNPTNYQKTLLVALSDNEADMEQITAGEVRSNSRKTILFNPNDNEADMDLTKQVNSTNPQKTILFAPGDNEDDMEFTCKVTQDLHIGETAGNLRKTIFFNQKADTEVTARPNSEASGNEDDMEFTCKVTQDLRIGETAGNSRKTIFFNQKADTEVTARPNSEASGNEDDMEFTCKVTQDLRIGETRKTISFNHKAAMEVTAQPNSEASGDMEFTCTANHKEANSQETLDKIFNDIEAQFNASKRVACEDVSMEFTCMLKRDEASKRRTNLFSNTMGNNKEHTKILADETQCEQNNSTALKQIDNKRKTLVFNENESSMEFTECVRGFQGSMKSTQEIDEAPQGIGNPIDGEVLNEPKSAQNYDSTFRPKEINENISIYGDNDMEITEAQNYASKFSSEIEIRDNLEVNQKIVATKQNSSIKLQEAVLKDNLGVDEKIVAAMQNLASKFSSEIDQKVQNASSSPEVVLKDNLEINEEIVGNHENSSEQRNKRKTNELSSIEKKRKTDSNEQTLHFKHSFHVSHQKVNISGCEIIDDSIIAARSVREIIRDHTIDFEESNQFFDSNVNLVSLTEKTPFGSPAVSTADNTRNLLNYNSCGKQLSRSDFTKLLDGELEDKFELDADLMPLGSNTSSFEIFPESAHNTLHNDKIEIYLDTDNNKSIGIQINTENNKSMEADNNKSIGIQINTENNKLMETDNKKSIDDEINTDKIEIRKINSDNNKLINRINSNKSIESTNNNKSIKSKINTERSFDETNFIDRFSNLPDNPPIELESLSLIDFSNSTEETHPDYSVMSLDELLKLTGFSEYVSFDYKEPLYKVPADFKEQVRKCSRACEDVIAASEKFASHKFACFEVKSDENLEDSCEEVVEVHESLHELIAKTAKECNGDVCTILQITPTDDNYVNSTESFYKIQTLYGTITITVKIDGDKGLIKTLQVDSEVPKTAKPIFKWVHRQFLEKLSTEKIHSSVGSTYTIFTLIDYLQLHMAEFQRTTLEFRKLSIKYWITMDEQFNIHFPIVNKRLRLLSDITIKYSSYPCLTEDCIAIKVRRGHISENQIKRLFNDCLKDSSFLRHFTLNVMEYLEGVKR